MNDITNAAIAEAEAASRQMANAIPAATVVVHGEEHMRDAKGRLVPISTIDAADRLEDETVRKIMFYADGLNAQIRRFKDHTLGNISDLLELLSQEYGVTKGGRKGNTTLLSFDGLSKVQLAVADQVAFGPQLQAAKALVDECLIEWASSAPPALRVIVQDAFDTEKEGQVSPTKLFPLLRYDIQDERWIRAMDAIRDAIQIRGSKEYVRFYRRAKSTDRWTAVTIDLAVA